MQKTTDSVVMEARVGMDGKTTASAKVQLSYDAERPFEIVLGWTRQRRFDPSPEFTNVMVISRDALDDLLKNRQDAANVRLNWGQVTFAMQQGLEFTVSYLEVEIFVDSIFRLVPKGYECEFAVATDELNDDDDVPAVTAANWAQFEDMLTMAADLEKSAAIDWNAGLKSFSGEATS